MRVYFALQQSFVPKFKNIIEEWARGKGFSGRCQKLFTELTDDQCRHDLPALDVQRSPNRRRPSFMPNTSTYHPSTIVQPQGPIQRAATLQDGNIDHSRGSSQQSVPVLPQIHQPTGHANGATWPPPPTFNPGPYNVSSPSELYGHMLYRTYPPNGPPVIHFNRDIREGEYAQQPAPITQNIQNYFAPGASSNQPPGEGFRKRISKVLQK